MDGGCAHIGLHHSINQSPFQHEKRLDMGARTIHRRWMPVDVTHMKKRRKNPYYAQPFKINKKGKKVENTKYTSQKAEYEYRKKMEGKKKTKVSVFYPIWMVFLQTLDVIYQ